MLLRALGLSLIDGVPTAQWGGGRLFGASADFFTITAVSRKRKVAQSIPRWEIDCLAEGYQRAIDEILTPITKNGFSGRNPNFKDQKKRSLLY